MNRPNNVCRTGRLRKRKLPHKRKTAEIATQHCLSMKKTLSGEEFCVGRLNVSHRA